MARGDYLKIGHKLADQSGKLCLSYFRGSHLNIENKAGETDFDPVTLADKASEKIMREILNSECPEDGILGEEFAPKKSRSGVTWILDPIDGTRAFMSGIPTWGILIAAVQEGQPFLGIIDQPYIGERFIGGMGVAKMVYKGEEKPLQTSNTQRLKDAILLSTFPEIGSKAEEVAFGRVKSQVKLTRYGLDCYAYALLAMGQIDLVIEAGLKPYDYMAPKALIEAAGGCFTNWQGGRDIEANGRVVAAANQTLLEEALLVLNEK